MGLLRVHSTIRHQPEQMQATAAGAGVLHRRDQGGVGEQLSILNHQIDAGDIHVHDAPCSDVEMAHFTVAHLPFRQSDEGAAGVNEGVGILAQQAVVGGLAR